MLTRCFENWSDIKTDEESNDEYESSSSNDEVENDIIEVDDKHGSSEFSESEEDSIVSDLMETTTRGRCGIGRGGVKQGRGRGRGTRVRETRERGRGVRRKSKERDGINNKYKWSKITSKLHTLCI